MGGLSKVVERAAGAVKAATTAVQPKQETYTRAVYYGFYQDDLAPAWDNNYVTLVGVEEAGKETLRKVFIRGLMPQAYSERMGVRYVRPVEMMRTLFDWWVQGKIVARFGRNAPEAVNTIAEMISWLLLLCMLCWGRTTKTNWINLE